MDRAQPPGSQPMIDRVLPKPKLQELGPRHHTVLSLRDPPNCTLLPTVSTFTAHIAVKADTVPNHPP